MVRSVLTYSTFGFLLRRGHRRQLAAFLQWAKANCPFIVSLLLTGSGDNLYRSFLSSLYNSRLKEHKEENFRTLHKFELLESLKRSRIRCGSIVNSVLNGWGIYRPQPNSNLELKTIKSRNSGIRRLHLLTGEVAPPGRARRLSSGDCTSLPELED